MSSLSNFTRDAKIPYLYIFTGYGFFNTERQKIESISGSYDLLKNRIFFTEETIIKKINHPLLPTEFKRNKRYVAWCTNINGVLHHVSEEGFGQGPGRVAKVEQSRAFHLPPRNIVFQTMYAQKEKWASFFSSYFKTHSDIKFTTLPITALTYDKFRKPDPTNDSQDEKTYANWYNTIKAKNETVYGYHILKTKAVVFLFTNQLLIKSTLTIRTPDDEFRRIIVEKSETGVICATLVQNEKIQLDSGLYTITVTLPTDYKGGEFRSIGSSNTQQQNSYEFTKKIDFQIKNDAGEFDLVCCDPVSVEESLLCSFSSTYPHLIQAVKDRELYADVKYTRKGDDKYASLPSSLKVISDRMNWMSKKTHMILEYIDADGGYERGWLMGNILFRALETQFPGNTNARNSIALAFSTKNTINAWNDFAKSMNTHILKDFEGYLWVDKLDDAKYARVFMRGAKLDRMSKALSDSKFGKKITLYHVNTKKFVRSVPGLSNIPRAVAWLEVMTAATSAVSSGAEIDTKAQNVENYRVHLFNEAHRYIQRYGEETFNREGMAEIETYHLATILEKAGIDEATIKLTKSSIATVLATGCAIPGPIQSTCLLIAFVMGGYTLLKTGLQFIDSAICESRFQDYKDNKKMLGMMANIGEENRNFMRSLDINDGGQRLVLQVCIRYEAVSGLVRLITRAGLTAEATKYRYTDIIKEYRIDDYIRRYLLKDKWVINKDGFNPVGLDEDWYYENDLNENDLANSDSDSKHKFEWGNNTKESMRSSNNVAADFQKIYPVHVTHSDSYRALSEHFKTIFPDIHHNCIAHSAIYYRDCGMTDEEADEKGLPDKGWTPIHTRGEEPITPLNQIRVLIILKTDTPEGIYPASIRVVRTDGLFNVKGPKYKRFIHDIESSLLDSEKPTWSEAVVNGKTVKHRGCVFYPFYHLTKEKIFGLKPLAFDVLDADFKYRLGSFSKMRYAVYATVGTGNSGCMLDVGKIEAGRSVKSGETEIPVAIDIEKPKVELIKVVRNGLSTEKSDSAQHKEKMAKMLDNGFLALRSSQFEYPELFDTGPLESFNMSIKGAGPFYIRTADHGPYTRCDPGPFIVPGGPSCWDTPLEIIMIVWCRTDHTNFERYEELNLPYNDLPITARLVNREGILDTNGPLVRSTVNHLGSMDKPANPGGNATFTKKIDTGHHPKLLPLVSTLESSNSARRDLAMQIGFSATENEWVQAIDHESGSYELFAAHFSMNYDVADERNVSGIRPFCKHLIGKNRIVYPEYYTYAFTDITMPNRIGLDVSRVEGNKLNTTTMEYQFHFQAPTDYSAVEKWNGIASIDSWVGNIPSSIDAR